MKPLFSMAIMALFSAFLFVSCADSEGDAARDAAVESVGVPSPSTAPGGPPTSAPVTANNSGVKHYICPKGCAGSGGDGAGTCPVCGATYEHNQAFHNTTTTPAATTPATPGITTPDLTPVPNPTTGQAQNAAGVYHYTCPKGCAGGAAAAGNCASCGGALAHNQAFHN